MSRWWYVSAVCFDWNGTLLNDPPFVFEGVKAIFRHFGKPLPTFEEYCDEIDVDPKSFYLRRGIVAPWEELKVIMNAYLATLSPPGLSPYARETLESFARRNIPLALVSLREPRALFDDLRAHQLNSCFQAIYGGVHEKSEMLVQLRRRFSSHNLPIVFVGDTPLDISAARKASCLSVAYTKGYGNAKLLMRERPDWVVDNLRKLPLKITTKK